MVLRILKSNTFLSPLLIPLIGGLFWFSSLRHPVSVDPELVKSAMPLFAPLGPFLINIGGWQVLAAFLLVLTNSFFVSELASSFLFTRKRSYLPGILYLVTVSAFKSLHIFLPAHLATLLVLIALYFLLEMYNRPNEITTMFNASFLLSLASLIYLPTAILFPLVWIAIFVLQKNDNWRLKVVPLLGFGLPWLFAWTIAFLSDSEGKLFNDIVSLLWSRKNDYLSAPSFLFLSGVVVLLTTLGSFSVMSVFYRMKVSYRKYFVLLYWMLGLIVASALGFLSIGLEIVTFSTIPVAYFISDFLLGEKRPIWKEVLTAIYIGTTVFALIYFE